MNPLNAHYSKLLGFGLLSIREALDNRDYDWANAEVDLLHNLPSLLDEPNPERHKYFWFVERQHYIDWISVNRPERPYERMRLYYVPQWEELEHVILKL